jgi:hypothetical protein
LLPHCYELNQQTPKFEIPARRYFCGATRPACGLCDPGWSLRGLVDVDA